MNNEIKINTFDVKETIDTIVKCLNFICDNDLSLRTSSLSTRYEGVYIYRDAFSHKNIHLYRDECGTTRVREELPSRITNIQLFDNTMWVDGDFLSCEKFESNVNKRTKVIELEFNSLSKNKKKQFFKFHNAVREKMNPSSIRRYLRYLTDNFKFMVGTQYGFDGRPIIILNIADASDDRLELRDLRKVYNLSLNDIRLKEEQLNRAKVKAEELKTQIRDMEKRLKEKQ